MTSCTRQLDDYIQHYGVKNYYEVVTSLMDQLRDEPLNVAVLGRRRHEKQLFLQAMCKNLAFNRAGLGASSQKRGSLQIPSFGNRTPSASNSLADVHAFFQNHGGSANNSVIVEEGGDTTAALLPSPVSGYGSAGAHTPPWKDIPSLEVSEQDEGVFVNEDSEGCDAEVAQLMALQANEAYTEENLSDILTYRYPEYPDIRFWDIPDFDAEGYSRKTYEEDVQHGLDFDAFLVTSGNRFLHPDDLWWAELLQKQKSAVFICTHMDREISRMKPSSSENSAVAEHATFRRVHSYYRKKFFKHSLFGLPLFIVSPSDGMKFDFPDLTRVLLKWKDRKQRARKNKLLSAALASIEKKHEGLQSTYRLASIFCGIMAGLPTTPVPAALADLLLYYTRYSSKQDFGLNAVDLEDCKLEEEPTEKVRTLNPRALLEMAPCSFTWLLQTAIGKIIMWATPDITPDVVQTSLSLVAVGGACIWSQVTIANQLAEHKAKSKMVVEHITNRKLVSYLKQIGDIGSTTAAGTRSSSPVSFSV